MADCRACGHPIQWATREDETRIALDTHPQAHGEDRYMVDEERAAVAMAEDNHELGYQKHVCGRL